MPILKVDTNLSADQVLKDFNHIATDTLAKLLNKPMQNVTVLVNSGVQLTIGGSDEPAAFVELRAIGGLKGPNATKVVETLTNLIEIGLSLPKDRFYINLVDLDPELVAYKGELRSVTLNR